ncbi:O-antigen ligase family protein [Sporolactobacillus pectinivorans]|uniref:O-antigen ligase family protein n=1 Tax=Sporolactobacillus pectinivorans TaxID=1591408 RepID=UPI000C262815|nr:O-antigen ligase family protein [Sporolactobacillus pectinivorans]
MKIFIYAAAFFFCLDDSPFMFGTGYKPISVIFILLYVLSNLPGLFRLRYKRLEFYIFVFMLICLCVSLFQVIMNHYRFDGLLNATETVFAGIICYLGFKLFVEKTKNNPSEYTKLFLWIVRGYGVAVFVGFLQFVYIYITANGAIASLIHLFVERTDFITNSRIHFSFSEPSFISLHTNLLLLPAVIILKKKGMLTRTHKFIVGAFFFLSLFALSIRLYIDIIVFMAAYLFFTTNSKTFVKRSLTVLLAGLSIVTLSYLIFVQNIFGLHSYHYYRMADLITHPSAASSDISTQIRSTYTMIGFQSFADHPLIGYGLGNYHYAYVAHFHEISPDLVNQAQELLGALTDYNLHTYDMFARLASEMGILGIVLIILLLYLVMNVRGRNFSKMMIFLLLYSQLQFDSLSLIPLYFWIAMLQSGFIANLDIAYLPRRAAGRLEASEFKREVVLR